MKKAIITGVTGTIGMALLQELTDQGMEVLAICREGSDRNAQIPHDPKIKCIECSMDRLENITAEEYGRYDVCYHLAWMGTTGKSRNDMYLQNRNVRYALDAVEMAARLGCHTFIGAGSQAEYGHVQGKLTPATATNPVTGYGIAKLCAGQMTRERAHQLGMRHVWVRVLSSGTSSPSRHPDRLWYNAPLTRPDLRNPAGISRSAPACRKHPGK